MTGLKQLTALIVIAILCASTTFAQEARFEKRTWRVVPRGSHVAPTKRRSNLADLLREQVLAEVGPADDFPADENYEQEIEQEAYDERANDDSKVRQTQYATQIAEPILAGDLAVVGAHDAIVGGGCCDAGCCDIGACDTACCDISGCDAIGCNVPRRTPFWVRGEYLYWQLNGSSLPPLITTSDQGTDLVDAGVLGLDSTTILLGNETIADDGRSGGRIELGGWIDNCRRVGWHLAYFGFEEGKDTIRFNSESTPILARPFYSVEPGSVGQNAELIGFPNEFQGTARVSASTSFEGAEALVRHAWINNQCRRLHLVGGYQYLSLDDDLAIRDFREVIGTSSGLVVGTTSQGNDLFKSENQFHGGTIGFLGSARNCRWTVDGGLMVSFGNTNSKVRIAGSTTSSVPLQGGGNDVDTIEGGLLALPTNIGRYENNSFAVAPQVHLNFGYDWKPWLRGTVGYRFLYWSQVARAGEQIDTDINLSQLDPDGLVGEPRPEFNFQLADFWAHGLNIGLECKF